MKVTNQKNENYKEIKVFIEKANDAKDVAFTAGSCKCEIKAIHGEYRVNAKSILGLLSLNLSEPIVLSFECTDNTDEYIKKFDKWKVS